MPAYRDSDTNPEVIRYLLNAYIDDLKFVERSQQRGRLIYIVDSTEVQAYISPFSQGNFRGFRLPLDANPEDSSAKDLDNVELAAISDSVLSQLFFESQSPLILLTGHASEVEDEIIYQQNKFVRYIKSQKPKILREIEDLMQDKYSALYKHKLGDVDDDSEANHTLLSCVQRLAPTIDSILHPQPSTSFYRIRKLIDSSFLLHRQDVDWSVFGFDRELSRELAELEPKLVRVDLWFDYLSALRRKSTEHANRADAAALAYVEELQNWLHRSNLQSRFRPVIVTRAVELNRLAAGLPRKRDQTLMQQMGFDDLEPIELLHHPRFLVVQSAPGSVSYGRQLQASRALEEKLTDYHASLRQAENRTGEIGTADPSLYEAWRLFERTNAAVSLPSETKEDPEFNKLKDYSAVRELIADFLSHGEARHRLVALYDRQIEAFRSQIDALLPHSYPAATIPARLQPASDRSGVWVLPIAFDAMGYFLFPFEDVRSSSVTRDLVSALRHHANSSFEQHLSRALIYACNRHWSLAENYASLAISISRLHRSSRPAGNRSTWDEHEAHFMLAQILRRAPLAGTYDEMRTAKIERYERAVHLLEFSSCSPLESARLTYERAAQLLELRLGVFHSVGSGDRYPTLPDGFEWLQCAYLDGIDDPYLRLGVLSLGVLYVLVMESTEEPKRDADDGDAAERAEVARGFQEQLERDLRFQRKKMNRREIPGRIRAVEALGFARFRGSERGLPFELRRGILDLQIYLRFSRDATAVFLSKRLDDFVGTDKKAFQIDLNFAPVWHDWATDEILDLIEDEKIRAEARTAYDSLGKALSLGEDDTDPTETRVSL